MAVKKDLIGKRFGKLVVQDDFIRVEGRRIKWLCLCDCGESKYILRGSLVKGTTNSCGCIVRKIGDLSKTRIYHTWANMKYRCFNKNSNNYERYGAKGIKVCDEWLDFMVFYEWSMSNGYTDTMTIDRIDAKLDYKPSNCRWISKSDNTANANRTTQRRKPKFWYYGISPDGERFEFLNASEFARNHSLNDKLIRAMVNGTKYKNSLYKGWKFGYTNKEV